MTVAADAFSRSRVYQGVSRFRFHPGLSCEGRAPITVSFEARTERAERHFRSTGATPTETVVPGVVAAHLFGCWKQNTSFKNDVNLLPKDLDGQVETLIPVLGAIIAVFGERHAVSLVHEVEGRFKFQCSCVRSRKWTQGVLSFTSLPERFVKVPKSKTSTHPRCSRVASARKEGDDPKTDQMTQNSRGWQHKEDLNCQGGYDCLNNATVETRPEAVGWAPPRVAGPRATSLRGLWVTGTLSPGNGGLYRRGGDPKTDHVTKGADSELPGWQPEEKVP